MEFKFIDSTTDIKKLFKEKSIHEMGWDYALTKWRCSDDITYIPYKVYKIDGYMHTEGGKWGENQYWCCPRDEEPTNENLTPFDSSETCLFGIEARPISYIHSNWHSTETEGTYSIRITRNGKIFHSFTYRDLNRGLIRAQAMLEEMRDLPFSIHLYNWQEDWVGRPVWFRDQPARIEKFREDYFEVFLVPDGISEFACPEHWKQDEDFPEDTWVDYKDGLWVECLDKDIYWFRSDNTDK